MIATTSMIQRIGPVKNPTEKPRTHKIKRIIPMIKSKLNIVDLLIFTGTYGRVANGITQII
jgi:hypothetical protein